MVTRGELREVGTAPGRMLGTLKQKRRGRRRGRGGGRGEGRIATGHLTIGDVATLRE